MICWEIWWREFRRLFHSSSVSFKSILIALLCHIWPLKAAPKFQTNLTFGRIDKFMFFCWCFSLLLIRSRTPQKGSISGCQFRGISFINKSRLTSELSHSNILHIQDKLLDTFDLWQNGVCVMESVCADRQGVEPAWFDLWTEWGKFLKLIRVKDWLMTVFWSFFNSNNSAGFCWLSPVWA